ncbi:MAG: hypothetical protein LBR38_08090, partial [Synergistaceae bacterium]|nr:hypothetical protein [Synergistaceae bacterium]
MSGDEERREALIAAYCAMSDDEAAAYRVLAVVLTPIDAGTFRQILAKTRGARLRLQDCEKMLEQWSAAGLVRSLPGSYTMPDWTCSFLFGELAVRDAVALGEFDELDEMVSDFYASGSQHPLDVSVRVRALRRAVYRGDEAAYEAITASPPPDWNDLKDKRDMDPLLRVLGNPIDTNLLLSLPPKIGRPAFAALFGCASADEFRALSEAFDEYMAMYPDYESIALDWTAAALMRGIDASPVIKRFAGRLVDWRGFAAFRLLMEGKFAQALAMYEEGLSPPSALPSSKIKRDGKKPPRRRATRPVYRTWIGLFYPILVLKERSKRNERNEQNNEKAAPDPKGVSDPKELSDSKAGRKWAPDPKAVAAVERYVTASREAGGGGQAMSAFGLVRFLARPETKPDEPFAVISRIGGIEAFFFLLFCFWLDRERMKAELREACEAAYSNLSAMGLDFLAGETAEIIRRLWPSSPVLSEQGQDGAFHLLDLVSRPAEWERTLTALSGIGTRPPAEKRFTWEISWRDGQAPDVQHVSVVPVEQTMQRTGWSKGMKVALRRVVKGTDAVPSMSEQDCRAAAAIREESGYYNTQEYSIDAPRALMALAGHPYLFRDDGSRVEVSTGEPRLAAIREGGGYHLSLSPFPSGSDHYIVTEDGPNRLRVTFFD